VAELGRQKVVANRNTIENAIPENVTAKGGGLQKELLQKKAKYLETTTVPVTDTAK